MEVKALDQVLGQLRAAAALAAGSVQPSETKGSSAATDFSEVFKAALDQVNTVQQQATAKAKDFEIGAPNAELQDVMISIQKASLSFQQMVQVRNRLVSAYQDIMNMQV